MTFTSFEFVFFFAAVLLIRKCIWNFSTEKWFLLVASYAFYMSWNIRCGLLLFFISLVNYFFGLWIVQTNDPKKRKIFLIISIIINLSALSYFKYTNFILDNTWAGLTLLGMNVNRLQYEILLPIGISFFTFQAMTYTIGLYRQSIQPCHSLRDFLLFVAFFPQILAGPINRAAELLPQFNQRTRATMLDFEAGIAQFAIGAVKKLVISDRIALHVNLFFSAPGNYDALSLLFGLAGYTIQIYCDFCGYSDMAIGTARIMGYRFPENFQMPYSAVNIAEFWRRWNITLSKWLRDYLYISLGGNRLGNIRTYANLLITFLLCGLWHGASWTFIIWGGIHGIALTVHRVWSIWNPLSSLKNIPLIKYIGILFSRILTLGIVMIGWLFFRADSLTIAGQYFSRLLSWSSDGTRLFSPYIFAALIIVFVIHLAFPKDSNWAQQIPHRSIQARILSYTVLALLIICFGATDPSPFIYFMF